ncbi:hypothetical protein Tco_0172838 [Tanacetum coccineum]
MGQCLSWSSSNRGVAPEPPAPVPMICMYKNNNTPILVKPHLFPKMSCFVPYGRRLQSGSLTKEKKEKIASALLKWVIFGEGLRLFCPLHLPTPSRYNMILISVNCRSDAFMKAIAMAGQDLNLDTDGVAVLILFVLDGWKFAQNSVSCILIFVVLFSGLAIEGKREDAVGQEVGLGFENEESLAFELNDLFMSDEAK